jgi:protein gp37
MRGKSHIEWTEATWNPVTGPSKLSAGCKNCYAERMAKRLSAMGSPRYANGFAIKLQHDLVEAPKTWKSPKVIFVNSMSDLFHESVPLAFIQKVFATMQACPQHTFQILTKRSSRLLELSPHLAWAPNIWIGVSVEDSRVVHRIRDLQQVPAASSREFFTPSPPSAIAAIRVNHLAPIMRAASKPHQTDHCCCPGIFRRRTPQGQRREQWTIPSMWQFNSLRSRHAKGYRVGDQKWPL